MIKGIIIGVLVLIVLFLYSACIVAGRADRREEKWFEDDT
jgi:hypothetical protein